MKPYQRIFFNTTAQYVRTFINTIISLYTVRVVLNTLGQTDFGVYTLIAGLVAMLSFLIASLTTTTQRFICYNQGKRSLTQVKKVFNNSLVLHIVIGLFVVVIFEGIRPLFFDGFLNIPNTRIMAAQNVYHAVVVILLISFLTAPYKALLISHENIVYISIADIFDSFLKLFLVLLLTKVDADKLSFYALIMIIRQTIHFLFLSVFCYAKYEECIFPRINLLERQLFKEQLSFASWYVYGIGCVLGRQQGIAIILNRIAGPAINAAYGIGFQLAGYTNFLSTSLANAFSPQIIKAEGAGNREKALSLSCITCKMMFFLLTAVCIPSIFEIKRILEIWLRNVPEGSTIFCTMVMVAIICDSLTLGLNYVNQAVGKIKLYTIIINTPKLITLPIAIYLFQNKYSIVALSCVYVFIELICSFLRIFLIKITANLDVFSFFKNVIFKEIFPLIVLISTCMLITSLIMYENRIFITFGLSIPIYLISIYFLGLTHEEKKFCHCLLNKLYFRNKRKTV